MANDAVEARMRQLAQRFVGALPADVARLRAATASADAPEAAGLAHRIAGRAGTFGFPAISVGASRLETLIAEGDWTGAAFQAALDDLEVLAAQATESDR